MDSVVDLISKNHWCRCKERWVDLLHAADGRQLSLNQLLNLRAQQALFIPIQNVLFATIIG